jgi:membrane protein insertase Oxa1/YidC/SpoIIIJ
MNAFYNISKSIANSQIVETTKQNMISFHELSSISWSLEIAIITIGVRTLVTFPLAINQHKILAKYESLAPEINAFAAKMKSFIDSEAYVHNYSPLKAKLLFTAKVLKHCLSL